jgi:hypothetical protein
MDKTIGTVAATALIVGSGAYLVAVAYQGNAVELGRKLKGETGYAQFLAAIAILSVLRGIEPVRKVTDILLPIALIASLLRVAGSPRVQGALDVFTAPGGSLLKFGKALVDG